MTLSLLLVVDTLLSRNAALEFGGRAGSLVKSVSDALLPEVRNELLHQLSLPGLIPLVVQFKAKNKEQLLV